MTVTSQKTYAGIWAALLTLLLLTYIIARFDLGPWNVVAALTIAVVKMLLVILFFMHVRHSPRLTWLFVAAGFIWLAIMINLTLGDYTTRGKVKRSIEPNPITTQEAPPSSPKPVQNK